MNPTNNSQMRPAFRPRAADYGLMACVLLGAVLGTTSHAAHQPVMYHPPTNAPGGVQAQSTITSVTPAGTNTTVCWYGMQGWYSVEMSSNNAPPWNSVGRTAASAHPWCLTVTNGGNPSAFFRLNQNNAFAGSGACAGCHGDNFNEWVGTDHARAFAAITNELAQTSELISRTVGYGQPNGFLGSLTTPQLKNVGCESCHGPSAWHKYSDHDLIRPAVSIDPKICGGCHTGPDRPTYDEYKTSLHAHVTDDIKYGFANGVYVPDTIVLFGTNVYGYYLTTNANGTLRTNTTTGIIHSGNGPGVLYDPGQDRAASCGICHSAATRLAMLNDWEARLAGRTNALVMPAAKDSAGWTAACATCHDPHSADKYAQLRNPTRSTNYYTMATTTDRRTVYSTNFMGAITTNVVFYSAAFANMYDPNVQVCAQCHNSRGARWDGRSYGFITNGASRTFGLQTNVSFARAPHYSPQYNVLIGILQDDYFNTNSSGVATNWLQRHGTSVSGTSGNYNTNGCATCHVPVYNDKNTGDLITGHTYALSTQNCTLSGCHPTGVPLYEEVQVATTNSLSRVVSLLTQWAIAKGTNTFGAVNAARYKENGWEYTSIGPLASITNAGPSSADQLKLPDAIKQARFNAYMVLRDGSLGVHNPRYVPALLADAETKVASQFTLANFRAYTTAGYTPMSVGFTNLATGVTNWSWNFGNGNTSTLATPTNIYASPGLYAVTLTATGPSGRETLVRTNYITVSTRPVVSFTGGPIRTGPAPLTVNFTNTSTSTNSVTVWRWTIDGKNTYGTDAVYTFTNGYTTNISHNIALRAITPSGNITTTSNAYVVVTPP